MSHRTRIVLIAVACMLIVPVTALAADRFADVPGSNAFHDDITWLAEAGVTLGCNPPANDEFCPSDNVTREQMAAFMRRLAVNQVVDAGQLEGKDATAYETRVWAASCGIDGVTGGTIQTTCLPSGGGQIPAGVNSEVFTAQVDVPSAGALQLSSTALSDATIAWSFTIDQPCSANVETVLNRAVNGHIWDADQGFSTAAHFTTDAPVGTHTIRLCGLNSSLDPVQLVTGSITAVWTPGDSVNTTASTASSPVRLPDLLGP